MSKGITDLPGLGRLIAEFRKLVLGLLRHRSERETRKLMTAEQVLKNDALRLKNQTVELRNQAAALQLLDRMLATAKKLGWSAEQTQEFITRLTSSKQIQSITTEREVQATNPKLLGE
jgi:hypothetical protein